MKKISFDSLKGIANRNAGLTDAEVISQRAAFGNNEIVEVTGHPWIELAKDTLKDPMIWFLLGIGTIFIFTGDTNEAIVLFVAILPLLFMDAFLHWRTQATTAGLRGQLASRFHVLRNDHLIEIDSRELVPGDLLNVTAGFMLPADGYFQNCSELQVDESVLTGEAFPIVKQNPLVDPFEFIDDGEVSVNQNFLGYAGTKILTGQGQFRILFTGLNTAYGAIVQSVSAMPHERTPMQKSISELVRGLILASGLFCLLLAGVRIYQGHGWLDALLSAATLAIAAIPEEFPVVFSFFLGVGVYRLAKKRALVRRAVSVENIGRVTYICTDKTGTITTGKLTLTHIDPIENSTSAKVLEVGLAASGISSSDPLDIAIHDAAIGKNILAPTRLHVFPFTEDRKRETVFISESDKNLIACMKGAPETVMACCEMNSDDLTVWEDKTKKWASEGYKIIACASKRLSEAEIEKEQEPVKGYLFCGLLAFEDPPRPEVASAISYCRQNGVRVLMITGDHSLTAVAIAKEVGLGGSAPCVASAEENLEKFQEEWLENNPRFLKSLDVVARCTPLQKLRVVNALKKQGELVAVTGDGVNDVPALKAADIGIAMGERGTRSAKEVSSIVLSDDNFSTIASAIIEGRQLFSNLKMSFEYLLLFHIPFVFTAALIPLFGFPILYLPLHIVWLELIIHPTALFAFQQESNLANRPPQNKSGFFSKSDVVRILFFGVALTVVLGFAFYEEFSSAENMNHARARTMALLTFWSAGLVFYFTRLKTRGAKLVFFGTIFSSILLIQTPWTNGFFNLEGLSFPEWLIITGIVFGFIVVLGAVQWANGIKSSEPNSISN